MEGVTAGLVCRRGRICWETARAFGWADERAATGIAQRRRQERARRSGGGERAGTGISGIGPEGSIGGGIERERAGEGGAGLLAAATNDGVPAVGERSVMHGPLHAGDTGGEPGGASARSEAKPDQAQAAPVGKRGSRISNEMSRFY